MITIKKPEEIEVLREGGKRLAFILQELAKTEKRCIIYSSHDLHLSLQYCDHVIALTHNNFSFYLNPSDIDLSEVFPETA
jgi:ABC-type cobalamin/Fe3+-siderophores transport system ATPase subunit